MAGTGIETVVSESEYDALSGAAKGFADAVEDYLGKYILRVRSLCRFGITGATADNIALFLECAGRMKGAAESGVNQFTGHIDGYKAKIDEADRWAY